jgi:hypothetical protein
MLKECEILTILQSKKESEHFQTSFYYRPFPTLLRSARSDPCCDILSGLYSSHDRGVQKPNDRTMIECLKEMLTVEAQGPLGSVRQCPIEPGPQDHPGAGAITQDSARTKKFDGVENYSTYRYLRCSR